MGRRKPNLFDGWSAKEREFCVQEYHKRKVTIEDVKKHYWQKFSWVNSKNGMRDKCPTTEHILAWVATKGKALPDEEQPTPNKLSGTQWGRKTGENRIIRTESIDLDDQHQSIKYKQRETKWCGPRPHNEKPKRVEIPVVEGNPYWWWRQYIPPVVEEVKPDKKQMLKEKFQGEVLELVDKLDAHGHAARESALVSLRAALQRHAVEGALVKHRATLADHVSRALRRGKDGERKAAAAIAPLLALQIGEEDMEEFVLEVRPGLIATATDTSASLDTRTECCASLAVLCYLMDEDITETLEVMRMYETIFSGSYLKDDGNVKVSGAAVEESALHAAALDGWALLFPLLTPNHALSLLNNQEPSFARLGELLEAASLEVRMAAGDALAIVYETVSDDDNSENALTPQVDELLPRLTELARDSDKTRAKKDRKIQRATFREILKYFEDGEAPCTSAHIGTETAEWSTWSGGATYTALATALGPGLQVLAPHCPSLRAALQLSTEVPVEEKPKKLQRHRHNKATSKARNFTRNKDKRSVALAF
ncbi:hypothetical protein PYW07_015633 [Mythimna separata]|uniref:Interferon-related developmental regulator N-terminal domain-containing protein n=1 Tax=Mythimna separata TaxID=271217 RepID=A0AAD7YYV6_MYTSE|nr:hypothetical protein PYW07_015633 [Mythimna separata]